jgi:hypothetical protein
MLNVGTVNADTGNFERLNETMFKTIDEFVESVLCSSAIPALFP